jgi:tetratricopeptide (TPR) repeat protein
LCEEAIEAAPVPATSRARPALHEALGRAYAGLGQMNRSIDVLRSAFEEARAEPADPCLGVRFGVLLASAYTDAGLGDEAYRTLDVIKGERDVLSDPVTHARLEWAISRAYAEHGQADLAERYARRVVSALAHGEHLLLLGRSHMLLGSILLDRSHRAEADAELDRAADVLERGGAAKPELALLDYERGRAALLDGRLDDAETLARAGLDRTEATEPGTVGMLYTLLAKITLARGDLDEARRLCNEAAGVLQGTVAVHYLDDVWQTLADVEERAGDLPAALAALRRVTGGRPPVPKT